MKPSSKTKHLYLWMHMCSSTSRKRGSLSSKWLFRNFRFSSFLILYLLGTYLFIYLYRCSLALWSYLCDQKLSFFLLLNHLYALSLIWYLSLNLEKAIIFRKNIMVPIQRYILVIWTDCWYILLKRNVPCIHLPLSWNPIQFTLKFLQTFFPNKFGKTRDKAIARPTGTAY